MLHHLVGLGLEVAPERVEHGLPVGTPARHIVKLFLHAGGKVVGDVTFEEAFEKRRQKTTRILCEETVFLRADVIAILQDLDDRGISRWTPDAQFLHPLHQTGFGEARRGLGEMLGRFDALLRRAVACLHEGQQTVVIVVALLVEPLFIHRKETGELHDLPGRAQLVAAGTVAHGDGRAFQRGRRHLAGHRALVDKVVELGRIALPGTVAGKVGRPDRLVRFLRILGLGLVMARLFGKVVPAEAVRNRLARIADRTGVHLDAVGTHVCDRALFVEPLGKPHRVAGRIAELARGFLLQGRCRERRGGIAALRLGLDVLDREEAVLDRLLRPHRDAFFAKREAVQLVALELDQARVERGAVMLKLCQDVPVFLRLERFDLALTLDNQAQGDRLDTARRFRTRQLAPKDRRESKSEQIVQRAAREVRIDQVAVQLSRSGHRVGHRLLGDGVEGDARHVLGQRLALGQKLLHVPRNRLSLAVRVGRKDQAVGLLGGVGDRADLLLLVAVKLPIHGKALVRADRAVLGRQVADVAVTGQDLEVRAEVFFDCLRLCGRLDDNKLHSNIPRGGGRGDAPAYTCTREFGNRPLGPSSR